MKKVLIGLLVILILAVASAFILIPKELTVSAVTLIHVNENALFRSISNENKWKRWWPNEHSTEPKKRFTYNGFAYQLKQLLNKGMEVETIDNRTVYKGRIEILPMPADSVAVRWQSTFTTSSNPFARILDYREAKSMRNNMEVILASLKAFSEKENLYDYNIHRTTIMDTFLVASKLTTTSYPSTKEIYALVENLKRYIKSQGAKETNYPMLNVTRNDSLRYTTLVGIPTDKKLEGTGNISLKQMVIYKDKTVTAEVKGGPEAIQSAYKELNTYLDDHYLTTPVIHWELLITDRSKETDSTKWVTKIFVPIV